VEALNCRCPLTGFQITEQSGFVNEPVANRVRFLSGALPQFSFTGFRGAFSQPFPALIRFAEEDTKEGLLPLCIKPLKHSFGRRNSGAPIIAKGRLVEGSSPSFENCFNDVVGVAPIEDLDVEGDASVLAERAKELGHQFGFKLTDFGNQGRRLVDQKGPIGEIEHYGSTRLIHGHCCLSVPANALPVAECLRQALAKANAYVFDRVVGVNLQIALSVEPQIKKTMHGEEGQHVIQKGDPAANLCQALSVQQ
jgi:hypothetical protein